MNIQQVMDSKAGLPKVGELSFGDLPSKFQSGMERIAGEVKEKLGVLIDPSNWSYRTTRNRLIAVGAITTISAAASSQIFNYADPNLVSGNSDAWASSFSGNSQNKNSAINQYTLDGPSRIGDSAFLVIRTNTLTSGDPLDPNFAPNFQFGIWQKTNGSFPLSQNPTHLISLDLGQLTSVNTGKTIAGFQVWKLSVPESALQFNPELNGTIGFGLRGFFNAAGAHSPYAVTVGADLQDQISWGSRLSWDGQFRQDMGHHPTQTAFGQDVRFNPVPEPGTIVGAGAAMAAYLFRRRRKED